MEQEQLKIAYEQIDNQILRLLLYFGSAVIVALSGALVYLWHTWRSDVNARLELDKVNAAALNAVANELERVKEALDDLEHALGKKKQP